MVAEPDRDRKDDTKMSNVQNKAFTDLYSTVSFGGGGSKSEKKSGSGGSTSKSKSKSKSSSNGTQTAGMVETAICVAGVAYGAKQGGTAYGVAIGIAGCASLLT